MAIQLGDLLCIEDAAHLATVKPSTIRAWLTKGKLPRVKIGRCTRILRSDLEDLVNAGRTIPANSAATAKDSSEGAYRAD